MKNLENYGVQELNAKEIRETDGGIIGLDDILIGLVIAVGTVIVNDWDNFEAGLFGEPYKK